MYRYQRLIKEAKEKVANNEIDEAIKLYRESISLKETKDAYFDIAQLYIDKRDYKNAIVMLKNLKYLFTEKEIGRNKQIAVLGTIAYVYEQIGDIKKAYLNSKLINIYYPNKKVLEYEKQKGIINKESNKG